MAVVSVEDLGGDARAVVDDVVTRGESTVITKRGQPVAVLMPIDAEGLDDHVLATAPQLAADLRHADHELIAGKTTPLR